MKKRLMAILVAVVMVSGTVSVPFFSNAISVEASETTETSVTGTAKVTDGADGSKSIVISPASGDAVLYDFLAGGDVKLTWGAYQYKTETAQGVSTITITDNGTDIKYNATPKVVAGNKVEFYVYGGSGGLIQKHTVTQTSVRIEEYAATSGSTMAVTEMKFATSGTTGTFTKTYTDYTEEAAAEDPWAPSTQTDQTESTTTTSSDGETVMEGYYTYSEISAKASTDLEKKAVQTIKKYNDAAKKAGWTRLNYKFGTSTAKKVVVYFSYGGFKKGDLYYDITIDMVQKPKRHFFKQAGKDYEIKSASVLSLIKDPTISVQNGDSSGNASNHDGNPNHSGGKGGSYKNLKAAASTKLQKKAVRTLKGYEKLAKNNGYNIRRYRFIKTNNKKSVVRFKYYGKSIGNNTYYFTVRLVQFAKSYKICQGKGSKGIDLGQFKQMILHPDKF